MFLTKRNGQNHSSNISKFTKTCAFSFSMTRVAVAASRDAHWVNHAPVILCNSNHTKKVKCIMLTMCGKFDLL